MSRKRIITLTTDFGLKDPFVGIMKGVILSINPCVNIVDISHGIESQNILEGAFVINQSYCFFPENTIHVVVVDPGVGGPRSPLIVQARGHYFIGPDNGVLSPVITSDENARVIEVTEKRYFHKEIGRTFHGRDIFAPVAAWLSKDVRFELFGRSVTEFVRLDITGYEIKGETVIGRVIYIDRFGNIITNIPGDLIDELVEKKGEQSIPIIRIGDKEIQGIKNFYEELSPGEVGAIINSFGLLEIFVCKSDAARILKIERGDIVRIILTKFLC